MIDDNQSETCQNQTEYVQHEQLAHHSNASQMRIWTESGWATPHENDSRDRECSTRHKHLMTMPAVSCGSELRRGYWIHRLKVWEHKSQKIQQSWVSDEWMRPSARPHGLSHGCLRHSNMDKCAHREFCLWQTLQEIYRVVQQHAWEWWWSERYSWFKY